MLSLLPKSPDPTAPSPEAFLEYKNSLDLLRKLLPPKQEVSTEQPGGLSF